MDPLDRGLVERVAGEPVEPVGGKDRDAAGGDAVLERRARGGAPSIRIETISLIAAPTTTRSIPARSRRVSISPKPASRSISPTAPAWPSPTSSPTTGAESLLSRMATKATSSSSDSDRVEAVGAGEQRLARLPFGDLRRSAGQSRSAT